MALVRSEVGRGVLFRGVVSGEVLPMGLLGKIKGWLNIAGVKVEYFLVAEADVQGTPFDPTHRVPMAIVE
jgi:hypothetical protein